MKSVPSEKAVRVIVKPVGKHQKIHHSEIRYDTTPEEVTKIVITALDGASDDRLEGTKPARKR